MALAFYDNFDRGGPSYGGNWTADSGAFEINGNALRATVGGAIHCILGTNLVDSTQRIIVTTPTAFSKGIYLTFRQSADGQDSLTAYFNLRSTDIVLTLQQKLAGNTSTIAARTMAYTYGASIDLQAAVVNQHFMAWVDLNLWVSGRQTAITNAGLSLIGLLPTGAYVEDYWLNQYSTAGYFVEIGDGPDESGNYSLTLYNSGRPWTPGTPGSPSFVAAMGSVEAQEITDEDTALVTWHPPNLAAEEAITDPLNDFEFMFGISAPPGLSGPSGGGSGLTELQADALDDLHDFLADYEAGGGHVQGVMLKLGALSLLAGSAYSEGDGTALGDLLDAALNSESGLAIIKNRIDLIRDSLDALTNTDQYTLPGVQEAIRGSASRDLTAVYNLIAGLTPADQTDVTDILNAIAAIRTGNLWTLDSVKTWIEAIDVGDNTDVLNELAAIRTANFWSLGHVMDAIAAITIPDYSTALDDLADDVAAIPTNPITDLSSVLTAISGVRGSGNPDLATLLTAINARPTNPITSLQSVLDAINTLSGHVDSQIELVLDAIAALTPGAGTPTAPVWPGIAGVTLGNPINLAQTFAYSGPCDGVIVALTSDPNNHGVYGWGTVTQYPRAGYLSFVSDNGDYSDVQPFSFPSNLICVQGMLHADGFIGRARPGATGTVTPWTITAP